MEMEESCSWDNPSPEKRNRKERTPQTFCQKWLVDARFSPWLQEHDTKNNKCICTCCDETFSASLTVITRHSTSRKHEKNVKNFSFPETKAAIRTQDTWDSKIMEGELRFSLLLVEQNLSFSSVKQIVECSKNVFSDSMIAKSLFLPRQKATGLIKNVLSEYYKDQLKEMMRDRPFSILFDESTDIAGDRNLCILVRFVHSDAVVTEMLDFVKLNDDASSTSVGLYYTFKNCLKEFNLCAENIVGCCSDNASVMVGKNEFFMGLLLKDNPNIFYMGCVFHSMHLVTSKAADELPEQAESVLHLIFSYVSKNPKKRAILREIQEYATSQMQKVINPSRTRWLALLNSLEKILEHYPVLISTFRQEIDEDKSPVASMILEYLYNPSTKAALQFMAYILPVFNEFNALFQSNAVVIVRLETEARRLWRLLCAKFLKPESYLDKTGRVNCNDLNNLLPLDHLNVGRQTSEVLATMSGEEQYQFKVRVIKFYQVAVNDLQARFPLGSSTILGECSVIDPTVAMSVRIEERKKIPLLLEKYKGLINSEKAEVELEELPFYFEGQERQELLALSPLEFSAALKEVADVSGQKRFSNFAKVIDIVMTLPHANADVEKIFAMVTDIKTKKRNRLHPTTMSAILRVKMGMSSSKQNCVNFTISDDLRKKYFQRKTCTESTQTATQDEYLSDE